MLATELSNEGTGNKVCIALPQYCVEAQFALSDRVCYTDCVTFKDDTGGCETCKSEEQYTLTDYESCEPTAAPE
jgi:hypothetical protein